MDSVILVNERDEEVGRAEKLSAHKHNLLHRAFSIFIFHVDNRMLLLQKRAQGKYHSSGLWSNTCCGHPRPGETVAEAAKRRLKEEMGFTSPLRHVGHFRYQTLCTSGLFENEVDHVFMGWTNQESFLINTSEVQEIKWLSPDKLEEQLRKNPEQFTPWLSKAIQHLRSQECFQSF